MIIPKNFTSACFKAEVSISLGNRHDHFPLISIYNVYYILTNKIKILQNEIVHLCAMGILIIVFLDNQCSRDWLCQERWVFLLTTENTFKFNRLFVACVAEIAPSSVFAMESRALRCIYIKSDNNKKKINASLILESN